MDVRTVVGAALYETYRTLQLLNAAGGHGHLESSFPHDPANGS